MELPLDWKGMWEVEEKKRKEEEAKKKEEVMILCYFIAF